MPADSLGLGYLGRVLNPVGVAVGTCFQVVPGLLVTAWHVLDELCAGYVGITVEVDVLDGSAGCVPAEVLRVDPVHDLAVLRRAEPLPVSVPGLSATDVVTMRTQVVVAGTAGVDDLGRGYRFMNVHGEWAGGITRNDQVPLGRLSSASMVRGMSGAPVRRDSDGVVVGVVSGRYNSADGWLRDSVWVARTENLESLLAGLAEFDVRGRLPPDGAVDLVLTVSAAEVRLAGGCLDVVAPHAGVPSELAEAIDGVRWARATRSRAIPSADEVSLRQVGAMMAESFLPGPIAEAAAQLLRRAETEHVPVLLGIAASGWARLPWETLVDPRSGWPLALHPLVTVYRKLLAPPVRQVPGPLRIVVAISAPDTGEGVLDYEDLDYERELRNVIAAVRGARAGDAQVRVVPFASTAAIHATLAEEPAHVLHLSGHGSPGALILEDEHGAACLVDADTFIAEAIPEGGMPPVVTLAACFTDAPAVLAAPSFAARLIQLGVSVVIGTETSVDDRYATQLFARIYGELVTLPVPDVVRAVANARKVVQQQLSGSPVERDRELALLDEWSVVTVLACAGSIPVFDPAVTVDLAPRREQPVDGLLARAAGEFVGRRGEQRRLPGYLVNGRTAGVVLHGIGGVGKTALAAELVRQVHAPDRSCALAVLSGELSIDGVFSAVTSALRSRLPVAEDQGAMLRAVEMAGRVDVPWQERFEWLRKHIFDRIQLLVVLDNFEDNLTAEYEVYEVALAGLLSSWASNPGGSRLLVTSRSPFTLPKSAHHNLDFRHLGPLSRAETLKLIWSLPALDRLEEPEQERVWRMVGGHPRTLEYLDALLRGGTGRYQNVTTRLRRAVHTKLGEQEGDLWLATARTLDAALAESLTLAADDVLLDELLGTLRTTPYAEQLLLGASVYREPVDTNALLFQIGDSEASTPTRAAEQNLPPTPPRATPVDLLRLTALLAKTSLLTVYPDDATIFVHRWTASELERRCEEQGHREDVRGAHQRAAEYWLWRAAAWPQDERTKLHDHREARYHLIKCDAIDDAESLTKRICSQLRDEGAWDYEAAFIHDTLARLSSDSPRRPLWIHCLGVVAYFWGDYEQAEQCYQQSLQMFKQLGDQSGIAMCHHQSGLLAQARGHYEQAKILYLHSLQIEERLGGQSGVAKGYHQLGRLAQIRGDYSEAKRHYLQSLEIKKELDDQLGMARSYHQLGRLAEIQGDYSEAKRHYLQSLEIKERLANRSGMAKSYHHLGVLAQTEGNYRQAERWYLQSLQIEEQLRDRAGMAQSYCQLGLLAQDHGDYRQAERQHQQALEINEKLGNRSEIATSQSYLGILATQRKRYEEAVAWHIQAFLTRVILQLPERSIDARALAELRAEMGDCDFIRAVRMVADEAQFAEIKTALEFS